MAELKADKPGRENKQNRVVYIGDMQQVTPVKHVDYNDHLKNTEKRQTLSGFDPQYNDILDYILKITHRIWEERGVGLIYDTYHNNVTVHTSSSSQTGIKPVVKGTLEALHTFPDRRLVSENVIWSEDGPDHYYTSHRISSSATNLGDSAWAEATGKKIDFYTIADCAIYKNRIYEEWLIRDNLWMVVQLGLDPFEVARRMAEQKESARNVLQGSFGIGESMEGQLMPEVYKAADGSAGEGILEMYSWIFGAKRLDRVKDFYHPDATLQFICNRDLCGTEEIQGTFISLLASFPNARHTVERVTCNQTGEDAWDAAVRWRLRGLHEGRGMFGEPSMKYVELLGISHYEIEGGKIKRERMLFDGLDLLSQIIAGSPEPAVPCEWVREEKDPEADEKAK